MPLFSKDPRRVMPKSTLRNDIEQHDRPVNWTGRTITLAISASLMAGCSISNGMKSFDSQESLVTTSVTKPAQPEGIASEDAEIIKSAAAASQEDQLLAWQNPETGNKGTITAIDNFIGSHGQQCKKFQTTVDTFMGISLYNGETCELKKGFWVLSWFLREDS